MSKRLTSKSVAKDALRTYVSTNRHDGEKATSVAVANLRLRYQELNQPLTNYIKPMLASVDDRIYPKMLPTQASGRWSTFNPPLTNFSKKCINPECPQQWHEKRPSCWSVRDCVMPDPGWFWLDPDLDAIEARIYALKVHDVDAIKAFNEGLDIHTPTACYLFKLPYPTDLANPHTSDVDQQWRHETEWRGKDDLRRGIAKNYRYGMQYALSPTAVLLLKDLEQFNLSREESLTLAHAFWELTSEQQRVKMEHMKRIRRDKVARTLYGARRVFFDNSQDTMKEGFNHEIQGTVVDYVNDKLLTITRQYHGSYVVHNAHDGFKMAFPASQYDISVTSDAIKQLVEGSLSYEGNTVKVTATMKVIVG